MPLIDPVTMSTTTTITKARQPSSVALHQPIRIKSTVAARMFQHIAPAAIVALFMLRFSALISDPVSTMSKSLPIVAALQVAYAVVCLPPAGSARVARRLQLGQKRRPADAAGPNRFLTALHSLLLTLIATPALHATTILFGAPFLTHVPHTLLCSAHLALLALFPLLYVHGVDGSTWVAVAGLSVPMDQVFGGLVGAFVGGWLGAVPIPLDWDREWQRWPVTVLAGVYGGWILGRVIGGEVVFGKRF